MSLHTDHKCCKAKLFLWHRCTDEGCAYLLIHIIHKQTHATIVEMQNICASSLDKRFERNNSHPTAAVATPSPMYANVPPTSDPEALISDSNTEESNNSY
jgi:hypothetical protein